LLPLAALFLYLGGKQLGGPWVGGLAAAFLGLNALVLVHGRRAMAEGTLIFAISFALWSLVEPRKRPWLSGLGIGLALGAKHSALALLPVGILAMLWGADPPQAIRQKLSSVGMFGLVLLAVTLALNPVVWSEPASALGEIFQVRMSLVQDQVQAQAIAEQLAIAVPLRGFDRLAVLIAHLFLAPPQFQEIGNYRAELDSSVARYLAIPGHALLRGRTLGGLSLGLTLAGLFFGAATLRTGSRSVSRTSALLLISTAALALTLYIGIPLPYQRYYVPLVPLVSLWSAFAVIRFGREMKKLPFIRAALG
jgi:4-amino-4-deoxy-L-arabinose transferase-like glycosyltransferase